MKRIVAFLDLLGFREFMSQDKEGAIRLLWNYETILAIKKLEDNVHPVGSYEQRLQALAEKRSVDSFEYFLPFSDSIVITSVQGKPGVFIKQLGSFVLESFLFTSREYRKEGQTTTVNMTHLIDKGNGTLEKIIVPEQWFPTIFRGGIASGEAEVLEKTSLISGQAKSSFCVAGRAVIEAVDLESKCDSPSLMFSTDLLNKIEDAAFKLRYVAPNYKNFELLWPALHFIEENDPRGELLKFNELFVPAAYLWKNYSHLRCSEKYFNLLLLIIRSAYAFFKDKLSNEQIVGILKDCIHKTGLQFKEKELLGPQRV